MWWSRQRDRSQNVVAPAEKKVTKQSGALYRK